MGRVVKHHVRSTRVCEPPDGTNASVPNSVVIIQPLLPIPISLTSALIFVLAVAVQGKSLGRVRSILPIDVPSDISLLDETRACTLSY